MTGTYTVAVGTSWTTVVEATTVLDDFRFVQITNPGASSVLLSNGTTLAQSEDTSFYLEPSDTFTARSLGTSVTLTVEDEGTDAAFPAATFGGTYPTVASDVLTAKVTGDTYNRLEVTAGNGVLFGAGTAAPTMPIALNAGGALQVGAGGDPNGASQQVSFVAYERVDNPNKTIMQHFVGFSFYTGTPGGGAGTLQGGSCESSVFMSPSNMGTSLGFEGIARVNSDVARTMTTAIGSQGTAIADATTTTVTNLISMRASGPFANSGTPTVTNAISLDVQQPTVGTNKFSLKVIGRTRLTSNGVVAPLEIYNAGATLQWGTAVDGTQLIGYASDGASVRMRLDSSDGATIRALFACQATTTIGIRASQAIGTHTGDLFQATDFGASNILFSVGATGIPRWDATANQQTTVGAAGAAAALPATPAKYLKIKDSAGTVLVIPCYAAS